MTFFWVSFIVGDVLLFLAFVMFLAGANRVPTPTPPGLEEGRDELD